ncbi:arginine--tRNA ligase, partial [Acinetobacter baumannii]
GNIITLRDVVDAVGRDAVRFMMCYRAPETVLDFDYAKVTEQSKENPVFYVQYAHARIASVLRNATDTHPALSQDSAAVRNADL